MLIGRGAKDREETLEIGNLNNARTARAITGKVADLGLKPIGGWSGWCGWSEGDGEVTLHPTATASMPACRQHRRQRAGRATRQVALSGRRWRKRRHGID
jgi:hypothetical protein